MADPKKGYLPGVYRLVEGTVDANGDFSITNVPKEGWVPGIYQLTELSVDDNGDTTPAWGPGTEDSIGIAKSISVTVDANGDLSETGVPQEGYVPGVYRVTTSTNIPKEGFQPVDWSAVIGSISGGIWEAISIIFNAPLTNSLIPSTAVDSTATFSRNDTDATVVDFEGLVRDVTANEARFVGARRVYNQIVDSEDFTNVGWVKTNVSATASQLTSTGAFGTVLDAYTAVAGDYVFSVELQAVSVSGVIQIAADSGTYTTVTLTGDYQRFSVQQTVAAGAKNAGIRIVAAGDVINARNAQLEFVEGQANQNPSEYVSVGAGDDHGANQDGVKYFSTENGNTVSTNVVTEATGSAITASTLKGILIEEARTNAEQNSEAFGSWTPAGGMVVTANTQVAPDGLTTADNLSDPGAGFALVLGTNLSISNSETVTGSVFVRKDAVPAATRFSLLRLRFQGGTASSLDLTFDTSTGDVATRVTVGSATVVTGYSESVGDYWRVFLVGTNDASGNNLCQLQIAPAAGSGLLTGSLSSAATGNADFWGAQIESGAYHTSYIPTAGASATRNAESLSYALTNIDETVGTVAFSMTPNGSTAQYIVDAVDATVFGVRASNTDLLYIDDVSGELVLSDGTNSTTATAMPSLVRNTAVKVAARWAGTSMDIGQDTTEANATFDGSMNESGSMRIGYSGANRPNVSIKNLRVYNDSVDDTTFTNLTT